MTMAVPKCRDAKDANSLYFRCMFHEFFYGPFADEAAVSGAIAELDAAHPMWDYDCFAIHYGNPDAKDYVNDFKFIPHEMREHIEMRRHKL